jgi:branched-chain amino acid transport system substrate-binding protein
MKTLGILSSLLAMAIWTNVTAAQVQTIRLGMIAPLTGAFATYGEHIRRGIEIASDDLKEKGINIEVSYEDGCLPAQVRSALTKLINLNLIDGLAGSYCVIGMVASKAILETNHIVSFQTSGATQEILNAGDYLFTTAGATAVEASKLAEHAYTKLGMRKVAILSLTTQWGDEFTTAFSKQFTQLGGKITGSETNAIGVNDFRSELTKLRGGTPDALVLVHVGQTLGFAIKQAREIGFTQQLLATADAEEDGVLKVAGDGAEGLQFFVAEPKVDTLEMMQFAGKFRKRFSREIPPLARHAYDATMLTANALNECQKNRECAKELIYKIESYSGASGVFSIESTGGVRREFALKMVKNKRFVKIH